MSDQPAKHLVAVIGAGPAGIFAARQLAVSGVNVVLLNRDIKPGGLAEYGIYYDKYKMKEGLRKQFRQILEMPSITYLGNVTVGLHSGLSLDDLFALGFQGVLVTVGAQGTKWLGLPGEHLRGVYHAKDLVYHYNKLPPYSSQTFYIGKRVALIGVGNVMMDIAHWLIRDLKVDEVVTVVRRGPAEVKFSRKEMEVIARNLDLGALEAEMGRCTPLMRALDQDVSAAHDFILSGLLKSLERVSKTRFTFDFLASPTRIIGDEQGGVCALEVEDNTMECVNNDPVAHGLGTHRTLAVDTVIFCIGDRVDGDFGLPVQRNAFVKNPAPSYPVEGLTYEVYDPQTRQPLPGVFVAGWSREASSGLVGVARKDGENGARAMFQYLQALPPLPAPAAGRIVAGLEEKLAGLPEAVVTYPDVKKLDAYELEQAQSLKLEEFKLTTNREMLAVMGKTVI